MVGFSVGGRHLGLRGRRIGAINVHRNSEQQVAGLLSITAFSERFFEKGLKGLLELREINAILRPLWTGHPRHDGAKIELEFHGVVHFALARNSPETLGLIVFLKGLAEFIAAPSATQVGESFFVHPKEAHRGAVFGSHVPDGGPVGDGKRGRAFAKELDKLSDNLLFAEHFGDAQDEVSRGDAFLEGAGEVDAHDFRGEKIHRAGRAFLLRPRCRRHPIPPRRAH